MIGQQLLGGHSVLGRRAEIDGDAVHHLRLDRASPAEQQRIVGDDRVDGPAERLDVLVGELLEVLDAREEQQRCRTLDDERVAVHSGHATLTHDTNHTGIAGVVHRWIEPAGVDQASFVYGLAHLTGVDALG